MKLFKNIYMEKLIEESKKVFLEIPIVSLVVNLQNDEILAIASNNCIGLKDSTAHAEVLAIREACRRVSNYRLENCALYCLLEPCPMCLGAIYNSRIKRLYFGSYKKGKSCEESSKVYEEEYNHKVQIYGGLYEQECTAVLQNFFLDKREAK